ncbi:hypothetical protein ACIBO9_45630 [Streptomyces prunicolor]|uniref:hypothetical protein n=1 Tax=Streptomyces prunicolor TaxID=67348 RepID=UPI0037D46A5A
MSNIIKFFVTTRDHALAALAAGPDASIRVATFGNFDAEEALLEWESHLTGRSFNALVGEDTPEVVAEIEDGPIVLALSAELTEALTSQNRSIDELARWWVSEKADDGMELEPLIASEILHELVDLINQEREVGKDVYCWTG